MFEFDDGLLFKSIASLISDEASRIVSLGLACHADMKNWLDHSIGDLNQHDRDTALGELAETHKTLSAIWLPGDFEKIAIVEEEEKIEEVPEKTSETKTIVDNNMSIIRSGLTGIAYKLGSSGNHKAAYLIERALFDIENIIDRK